MILQRLFDLDMQLVADFIIVIFALLFLLAIFLGLIVVIKLLLKELRKK